MSTGKCESCLPAATSSAAEIIDLASFSSSLPSSWFASAQAAFRCPNAWMTAAETVRTTHPWPSVPNVRDNTVIILSNGVAGFDAAAVDADGRSMPQCAAGGSGWFTSIKYAGLQFERCLYGTTFYTHTLPPNWNKNIGNGPTQQYNCGDSTITYFHVAASSYHSGGVNVCLADGSVRFVSDNIDFRTWQAMGTRAGGEPLSPP